MGSLGSDIGASVTSTRGKLQFYKSNIGLWVRWVRMEILTVNANEYVHQYTV